MKKMFIHYDNESDYIEVRFGKPTPSYYEDMGDDLFKRRDEKTDEVVGYAFFNVSKRKDQIPQDIEIELPTAAST